MRQYKRVLCDNMVWLIHTRYTTDWHTWHIYVHVNMCVYIYVCVYDVSWYVTWLTHIVACVSFVCVIWLIYMSHSFVVHDSFICLIRLCDMTDLYVSFVCVTWLIHMSHSFAWHDSFISVTHIMNIRMRMKRIVRIVKIVTWMPLCMPHLYACKTNNCHIIHA